MPTSKNKRIAHTAPQARQKRTPPAEATRETTRTKRMPKAAEGAKASLPTKTVGASKREVVLLLLQREGGATLQEIVGATGWQKHTIRGFISTLPKKTDIKITSTRRESDKARVYEAMK